MYERCEFDPREPVDATTMNLTRSSRWKVMATLLVIVAAATIIALSVPKPRWLSTMGLLAGLTAAIAGSNALLSELGPRVQRWAVLVSVSLAAGTLGLLVRMILTRLMS